MEVFYTVFNISIGLIISNNFKILSIPRKLFINEEEFMVAHDTDDNKVQTVPHDDSVYNVFWYY